MGRRASTQGDVYSFGVLLLEMVTGRRPTDVLFHQGSSLHEWVKSRFPDRLDYIVDQAIGRFIPSKLQQVYYQQIRREVIVELVELGLMCTKEVVNSFHRVVCYSNLIICFTNNTKIVNETKIYHMLLCANNNLRETFSSETNGRSYNFNKSYLIRFEFK